jgi:hypothetical protein
MRTIALTLLFSACGARAVDTPDPCCAEVDGMMTCKDAACPELVKARECTTLAFDHTCQVPLTDDCQAVLLERTGTSDHRAFQTVYCF